MFTNELAKLRTRVFTKLAGAVKVAWQTNHAATARTPVFGRRWHLCGCHHFVRFELNHGDTRYGVLDLVAAPVSPFLMPSWPYELLERLPLPLCVWFLGCLLLAAKDLEPGLNEGHASWGLS